ncbi:putative bifunctional diguanylate cyclase/phosphodiesterase, partial [Deinococcus pimensis]|uniref:putative bifunctional diguanylate cyclase/phosphodiesterase n=1 Tax=Deinococcus pimensis TaxID=309888 RepID=UPI000A0407C0
MKTTIPPHEHQRLRLLRRLQLLDTPPEAAFDHVARAAAAALGAPIVLVSLVDRDRQWFKACHGLDLRETHRDASFCAHALDSDDLLVVPDALRDERFRDNPLVLGHPGIRFYAGAPLVVEDGLSVGTLCVIDTVPRAGLAPHEETTLRELAALTVGQIRAREDAMRAHDLERLHRDVVDHIHDVVFQTDARGCWTYLNHAWTVLTGHDAPESLGRSSLDFVHVDDRPYIREVFRTLLTGEADTRRHEVRHVTTDGYAWVEVRARGVRDVHGVITGTSGTVRDITAAKQAELDLRDENAALERRVRDRTRELQRVNEQLRHDALHDPLTRLGNRAMLESRLHALLEGRRVTDRLSAVVLIDCDRFKQLNDTLGRAAGDELLKILARRFERELRLSDLVTRFGGDDFGILLDGLERPEDARAVAERLSRAVERPVRVMGRQWHMRASVGVALLSPRGGAVEDVLRDAEIAMYRAKAHGPDKVVVFEPSMHETLARRTLLEGDLRQALRAGQVAPHYQPIVRVDTGELHGLEALARWTHPTRGLVSPAEFIPVAEESGLVIDLDRRVFELACAEVRGWMDGGAASPDLTLSVNASARQFLLPDFADFVRGTLERTGFPPGNTRLEITESLLLHEDRVVRDNLAALSALGVQVHIDDFGTGYSSLAYVQRLSASALKIDRSFVGRLGTDRAGEELVRAVLVMARALGMNVVAEGVETEAQWTWLRGAGCGLAQGFLFSRPLDPAATLTLLR